MSTPIDPTSTTSPVPIQQPSSSPTDAEIRALASKLTSMADIGPYVVLSQAVVTAVDPSGMPPTATIALSGSSTPVAGIRFLSSYTPVVSDTVQVLKQSNSILILGHAADTNTTTETDGGWQTPTLASGFTSNGNSNGDIKYRRVMDNGVWKMQWKGSLAHTSGTTILGTALGADYRPSAKRSILVSRDVQGGSNDCQIDFNTDGTMTLVGGTTGPSGTSSEAGDHSHTVFDDHTHSHGGAVAVTSFADSGTDTQGGHTHTVGATVVTPTWIGLNMVEYFL